MEFKISREFLTQIEQLIKENKEQELLDMLQEIHYADIAEIMEELDDYGAIYIFNTLDSEKTSEILLELDEEVREKILR
ncbi:MAG: magnesium transporter, partial [Flavobacterium sp.]|nr:magnesium transporter [Flavobacterium sp.]